MAQSQRQRIIRSLRCSPGEWWNYDVLLCHWNAYYPRAESIVKKQPRNKYRNKDIIGIANDQSIHYSTQRSEPFVATVLLIVLVSERFLFYGMANLRMTFMGKLFKKCCTLKPHEWSRLGCSNFKVKYSYERKTRTTFRTRANAGNHLTSSVLHSVCAVSAPEIKRKSN